MKYIAKCDVGDDIHEVLCEAAFVELDGNWFPVLGYDPSDDVLCLENFCGNDYEIHNASKNILPQNVKVAVQVTENDLYFKLFG
jgi:hypothetical protein